MLDLKTIVEHPDRVRADLARRGSDLSIEPILEGNERRKALLQEVEALRAKVNSVGPRIGQLMREGNKDEAMALREEAGTASKRIKAIDPELSTLLEELKERQLELPNLLSDEVPDGPDEAFAREEKVWGEPPTFDFPLRDHADVGKHLGILDLERAAKITGSRFAVLLGAGAALTRALKDFMIDVHTHEHGYTEVLPPFLCNTDSFYGTGQLPKFAGDLFRIQDPDRYWLVPTAEVPVTNLHRDEILEGDDVEKAYVAYTACFRSEAGAAGKDTRGILRQHQFDKVELVRLVREENGWDALERLTLDAEVILERLGLPYRRVTLSSGDTGFSSHKTFDLEVWLPSQGDGGMYREISSCSYFADFQARRMNLRYRPEPKAKPRYLHTLNGSGLAIGRTIIAILENFQREDGTVDLPEVLHPYMRCERIEPRA